jgi:hypothetical protein
VSDKDRRSAVFLSLLPVFETATYADAVARLEELANDESVEHRGAAALLFAPAHPLARRFANSTSARLGRPKSDPARLLAERAVHALASLQSGPGGHLGRPRVAPLSAEAVGRILDARRAWDERLRPVWAAAGGDRASLRRGVVRACHDRFPAAAYAKALDTLLARRALRPADLATQLAAWQEGVSVRCVRAVVRIGAARPPEAQVFA